MKAVGKIIELSVEKMIGISQQGSRIIIIDYTCNEGRGNNNNNNNDNNKEGEGLL